MSNVVLEARHIKKDYKNKLVVKDVSFELFEGQILGFLGPNGSGKSTIIKIITGLAKPNSGQVYICGHNVKSSFEKAISNAGSIIDTPKFYENLTGYANLKLYSKLCNKSISNERINNIIKLVGMEENINKKVSAFSLGMKQRLGIAQALLSSPKLLILDEPTNGLDVNGIIDLRNLLKNLAEKNNIAVLISSHNVDELERVCDNVAIINDGNIIEIREIEHADVIKDKKYKIAVNYPNFAGKLVLDYFNTDTFVVGNSIVVCTNETTIREILNKLKENRLTIFSIDIYSQSLEQLFIKTLEQNR